jgi:hypothetical protein
MDVATVHIDNAIPVEEKRAVGHRVLSCSTSVAPNRNPRGSARDISLNGHWNRYSFWLRSAKTVPTRIVSREGAFTIPLSADVNAWSPHVPSAVIARVTLRPPAFTSSAVNHFSSGPARPASESQGGLAEMGAVHAYELFVDVIAKRPISLPAHIFRSRRQVATGGRGQMGAL